MAEEETVEAAKKVTAEERPRKKATIAKKNKVVAPSV